MQFARHERTIIMSNLFVCVMGVGTVFVGLVCLVYICMLTGYIIRRIEKKPAAPEVPRQPADAVTGSDRQQLVAAVSAVIAEELGENVSSIRIKSFRKL